MSSSNANKHLTCAERQIIETGIRNGSSKASIAETLGKDKSTIGKEIKNHRTLKYKCGLGLQCAAYVTCTHGRSCRKDCADYVEFRCRRRDRSPGACNGCEDIRKCHFDHYFYDASNAQHEYSSDLHETRKGINISKDELRQIGEKLLPYIRKGLSPYAALKACEDIDLCEKTIYNYIESGAFRDAGVDLISLDLRRQPSRKISKKKAVEYKPRNDRSYLKGRLYSDYEAYIKESPDAGIVEMDTVYNDMSNGPFMQTFRFLRYHFTLVIFHKTKTAEDMYEGILLLEKILGEEIFAKEVNVLKTDRGSEFTLADRIETRSDGTRRTRVFYCDPMASGQKGSLENSHEPIRYICPKGSDLYALGLDCQEKANLLTSHTNSFPKEKLNGKTPFQLMKFLNPAMAKKLEDFGITEIKAEQVVLKPYLLK